MDPRPIVVTCCLAGVAALLMLAVPAAADKLYKWTDTTGNIHYTDLRPTEKVRAQERRKFGDKPADVELPYSLQKAVGNHPVTLFTADTGCADACVKASKHLKHRGVPYTEKNARDGAVAEEVKAANGGKLEVPFLKIGNQFIRGYEENEWNTALDAAGYPKTAVASSSTIKANMKRASQHATPAAAAPVSAPKAEPAGTDGTQTQSPTPSDTATPPQPEADGGPTPENR